MWQHSEHRQHPRANPEANQNEQPRRAVTPSSRSPTMDIYNLTEVDTTMDGKRGVLLQGFNIIGAHGQPVVTLSFETQAEAEAAQKAMLPVVRAAKLITPHVVS
jgi:hypothetical protein